MSNPSNDRSLDRPSWGGEHVDVFLSWSPGAKTSADQISEAVMLIMIKTIPNTPDPRITVACIRACIWAGIEGWPYCVLR